LEHKLEPFLSRKKDTWICAQS